MSIKLLLTERVSQAMQAAGVPAEFPPAVSVSKQVKFGDFQANGVMGAAKKLKQNPRELAQQVLSELKLDGIASKLEVAGPGFINIFLDDDFIAKQISSQAQDSRLGVSQTPAPANVVIDYSGPNLAKEMHVGHLRSTIIGDCVAKAIEACGDAVIRQNHMGDWGTQFGMLIAELEHASAAGDIELADLEKFYQQAKRHFDEDESFAKTARDYVVRLQSGDAHCLKLWQQFIDISIKHSEDIYELLDVSLSRLDIRAESAYNDDLPKVVEALVEQGLVVEDAGAKVAFLEELADKEGKPSPAIVQKADGGYLYATTDLAAAAYRAKELKADRVMYFIDARQSLHMQQVFCLSRKAKFVPEATSLEHHAFGTMMGKDGKPFKTRTGGTVKLAALLAESVERAAKLLKERETDLSAEEQQAIARTIGVGAVKYADLSKTRTNDYIFDWDAMLSFEGNTAPYLQYAYTRIRSVFRKAGTYDANAQIALSASEERALVLQLERFGEVIAQVADTALPHTLCNYLYDIASAYMSFYEHCPILKEGVAPEIQASRLRICDLTAQVLQKGLNVLGIDVMERM